MTVAPTSSAGTNAPAANSASSSDPMNELSGNFSTFLTLLTAQLKNQDPTSPMDSNSFTQQLVMYSQVKQQIDTNTNLNTLIGQGVSNAALMTKRVIDNSFEVLAIHLVTILQAIDYLDCHDSLSSASRNLYDRVRPIFPKFVEDKAPYKQMVLVKDFLENADNNAFAK